MPNLPDAQRLRESEQREEAQRRRLLAIELLAHPGWKDVVLPYFSSAKDKLYRQLRHVEKYEQFVGIQQALCALDNLEKYVNVIARTPVDEADSEKETT